MRAYFVGLFAVSLVARQVPGQASPPALPQVACPPQGCNVGSSHVVHISSSANVRLVNGVLHYVTGQVLQNNGGENAEVTWTLPLPPSAAFHNLTMSINGEMILGEIYTKARARAIYDAIVATKRDPALVEWINRDLLQIRIYPIFPAETKYLEMRLEAVAKQTANVIRVDYFAGSNSAGHLARDVATVTMSFSYPDSAHYGAPFSNTHTVGNPTVAGGMRTVTVSGKTTAATLFLPVANAGAGSISVLPHAVAGEDGYALINIVAPALRRRDVPRDVVIALDVSSSMSGQNFTRAIDGARAALSALGARDRFRIVAFANSVRSHDAGPVAATERNIGRASRFLSGLEPAGYTNTVAALEDAFSSFDSTAEDRSHTLLLLTDGAPSTGEVRYDSILSRVAAQRGRAQIFVFQVGSSGTRIDLLKDLAQMGGGTVHPADAAGSIVDQVGSVMRSEEVPVISDLRVRARPIELKEIDSAALENMSPGESRTFAVRYRGSGMATVTVSGVAGGDHVSWSERVQFPSENRLNAFAARFWATERIGAIVLNRSRGCGISDADSVISRLGFRHSIPTTMTSYLILEPGVRIGANGQVLNADDFKTQKPVSGAVANAAARSGGAAGGSGQALTLTAVVTTGLADPATGTRAPFSVATVSAEKLEVASFGSPLEALAGKVAGLQVRGGNLPGSDVVIQIRNPLSIYGYTQPLIIVDGVIQMQDDPTIGARAFNGNPLNVVSENIETIEVLRGAAAAALYGQRAANGVINITTKRGNTLPLINRSTPVRNTITPRSNTSGASQVRDVPAASAVQRTCDANPRAR